MVENALKSDQGIKFSMGNRRMKWCKLGIEFDCCQGETFCCRDLGRFRKSGKCVTGLTTLALSSQRRLKGRKSAIKVEKKRTLRTVESLLSLY